MFRSKSLVHALLLLWASVGQADIVTVEPDDFSHGEDISTATVGVTLSTVTDETSPILDNPVFAVEEETGNKVFSNFEDSTSFSKSYMFRADFSPPTSYVKILASAGKGAALARVFDSSNNELESYVMNDALENGDFEEVEFNRATPDISYMLIGNPPVDADGDAASVSRRELEDSSRLLLDTLQYDARELLSENGCSYCRDRSVCYSAAEIELPRLEQPQGYRYCEETDSDQACGELCAKTPEIFMPLICQATGPWLGNGCVGPLCAQKAVMCKPGAVRRRCNDRCRRVREQRIALERSCDETCGGKFL